MAVGDCRTYPIRKRKQPTARGYLGDSDCLSYHTQERATISKKIHTYAKAIRMSNLAISNDFTSLTADGNTIDRVNLAITNNFCAT